MHNNNETLVSMFLFKSAYFSINTKILKYSSELHIGKEHCCLRGIDQLHGPTFHSICGNLIIYEPSLKKPFIFEHDRSLCAIINLLPIAAPLYEDGKNEKIYIYCKTLYLCTRANSLVYRS